MAKFRELSKESVKDREMKISEYWNEIDLLHESVNSREVHDNYIFYDGPPTANGKPGIHHVISRTLKDMTCRYKTMKGFKVKRKAGWDTHGLPVEIEVEKKFLEWKYNKLKEIIDEAIEKYTKLLNTEINYYKIKKLSSAWGIYHRRENYISFNIDLIEKDIESIDYVVLHEICHIFYMDHQKKFWALVEKYMPDYKIRRKKLKS